MRARTIKQSVMAMMVVSLALILFMQVNADNDTVQTSLTGEPCPTSGVWPAGCVPVSAGTGTSCPSSGVWPAGCIPATSGSPITPSPAGQPCPNDGTWPAGCIPTSVAEPSPTEPPAGGEPCPTSGVWPPNCVPGGQSDPDPTTEPGTTTPSTDSVWVMNTTGKTSPVFDGVAVNVTNVDIQTIGGVQYQCITTSGIPDYETVIDQQILNGLTTRPNFATDFANGIGVSVGDNVLFGEDIGYTPTQGCTDVGDGYGYWPFGPSCPANQSATQCFTLEPQPAADNSCSTGLTDIGAWVNGVAIFNWQDGQSYQNQGVWTNEAFHFEIYDLDICVGHSANGQYHHHSHPTCLADQLGDNGSTASPIYGYSADGYPIYGPWESAGTLVNSCWKTRDYSAGSPTGCDDGTRSCLLVDQYDITQGTTPAASAGPGLTEFVTSMSGNPILAESGAYFQDYYYDPACTAQGSTYLDEHNGHDTGSGYHYHVTMEQIAAGEYNFTFPFYNGPAYYGELPGNAIASCSTGTSGGPGGGGPGGGGPPSGGRPDGGGPPRP